MSLVLVSEVIQRIVCVISCQGAACRSSPDVPGFKTPAEWGDGDVSIGQLLAQTPCIMTVKAGCAAL